MNLCLKLDEYSVLGLGLVIIGILCLVVLNYQMLVGQDIPNLAATVALVTGMLLWLGAEVCEHRKKLV